MNKAIGRPNETFEQSLAGNVFRPDEILHVEAALRRIRERDACGKAVLSIRHRMRAGPAGMRGKERLNVFRERRPFRSGDRLGWSAPADVRQAGTCAEHQRDQRNDNRLLPVVIDKLRDGVHGHQW